MYIIFHLRQVPEYLIDSSSIVRFIFMKNTKLYAYAPSKFRAHDASFEARRAMCTRVRGLEGNIFISLRVVLFVTTHSAAIGKELNNWILNKIKYL